MQNCQDILTHVTCAHAHADTNAFIYTYTYSDIQYIHIHDAYTYPLWMYNWSRSICTEAFTHVCQPQPLYGRGQPGVGECGLALAAIELWPIPIAEDSKVCGQPALRDSPGPSARTSIDRAGWQKGASGLHLGIEETSSCQCWYQSQSIYIYLQVCTNVYVYHKYAHE